MMTCGPLQFGLRTDELIPSPGSPQLCSTARMTGRESGQIENDAEHPMKERKMGNGGVKLKAEGEQDSLEERGWKARCFLGWTWPSRWFQHLDNPAL